MDRPITIEEYELSMRISAKGYPFYAIMTALMRDADNRNLDILRSYWPEVFQSFMERRSAKLGVVERLDGMTPEQYYESKQRDG